MGYGKFKYYGFTIENLNGRVLSVTTPDGEVIKNPTQVSKKRIYLPKSILWISPLLASLLLVGAFYLFKKQGEIETTWPTVHAQVISIESATSKKDKKPATTKYQPTYEFAAQDGSRTTFKGNWSSKALTVGTQELIRYNPLNPKDFILTSGPTKRVGAWALVALAILTLIPMFIVSAFGPIDKAELVVNGRRWEFKASDQFLFAGALWRPRQDPFINE